MTTHQIAQKTVTYLRVSTREQGDSGLGIEAQRHTVSKHIPGAIILEEYIEVESGTRKKNHKRPQLAAAMAHARATGSLLVVAKLDRLARDTAFLLQILDDDIDVSFCDLPMLPPGAAGRFVLTMFAAVAEFEGGLIGERTKAALQACKARGVKLGGFRGGDRSMTLQTAASATERASKAQKHANDIEPMIALARSRGHQSLASIAAFLNEKGVKPPRGKVWYKTNVKRVMDRFEA